MRKILAIFSLLMLAACGDQGASGPSKEPPIFTGVKIGKPYSIAGQWYKPEQDDSYDKTGMASWYGPGFHGKKTANGEVYNQYDFTAAHPTLPMPSFLRVTNMQNGKQVVVRVNDRGPFHSNRILDLSKAAAEKIGLISTGTARVRVQYLPEETQIYIASKGKIFPNLDDTSVDNEFASSIMSREQVDLPPEQDAKYYPVEVKELDKNEFIPAPVQIADNTGPVVDSAPILSVETKESKNLTPFVAPAYAEEAPYISAREQKPEPKLKLIELTPNQYDVELNEVAKSNMPHKQRTEKRPPSLAELKENTQKSTTQKRVKLSSWSVQIASFSERKNAEALTMKLMPLGQPELQPVLVDGVQWYRVYLHPLAGAEKEKLIAELQKIGLRDARVVN